MKPTAVLRLQEALQNTDLTDYGSIPFWSWNNELDETELVRQIEEMKEAGMGGFIMHARIGLKTEYLGEKWFSCIDACLKKARELHMNAWVYDENGWPSGFVGGKLLAREDFRAQYLSYAVKPEFDAAAYGVYKKTEAGYVRLAEDEEGVGEYHTVYLCTSPANTDILNPEVVDAFIAETHEKYYARFSESFGRELVGFFTDEPQYFRWATPYTRFAEPLYRERYGEELRDGLVYLFLHDENGYAFRSRYFGILNELYTENFYKKLYDWCESHNCKLTGHSVEEPGLAVQMWGGAAVMPSYEFEHIPGIDCLGRYCPSELAAKQVGSVAAQLGKKQVLTETFGCAGYDATPRELASIAEMQFFSGVNLLCQHLLPYSLAAQGKTDHPPVFSHHNNWWEQFRTFNDHFTALGYLVANTNETYDVGVLHPMRSIYLDYVRAEDYMSVKETEDRFAELLAFFRQNGIRYQLLDERLLARHGRTEGDKLILGNCAYSKLVIPYMPSVSRTTLNLLKNYRGGLCMMGEIGYVDGEKEDVSLVSNLTRDELLSLRGLPFFCADGRSVITTRTGELGDYIFIKNMSQTEESRVTLTGVAECYQALNLETFALTNIANELTLPAAGSLILLRSSDATPTEYEESGEEITADFAVTDITENYLVLDFASYSLDGATYSERQPIQKLFESVLRMDYRGDLYIKQNFTVKDKTTLTLMLEDGNFRFVRVNGRDAVLERSDFDVCFAEADITDLVKEGENELLYCVEYHQHDGVWFALFDPEATESVRNCLYYDTHLEPCYIKGNFILDGDFAICKKDALPPVTSNLKECGYPFFMGVLTLEGTYSYNGIGSRLLALDGRFAAAEIEINGKRADMVLDSKQDVTHLLQKGENRILIRLRSSLRNLFGPHHFKPQAEPWGVNPTIFTFRGEWNGATAPNYTPNYNCVPFGADRVLMLTKK